MKFDLVKVIALLACVMVPFILYYMYMIKGQPPPPEVLSPSPSLNISLQHRNENPQCLEQAV
ncbi:hypothetical protein BDW22DRAFT_1361167 [Trametopsis cervina]|nr:hypothetical protein BDW22DRAFT_1361167 [Trametopsis cervina]